MGKLQSPKRDKLWILDTSSSISDDDQPAQNQPQLWIQAVEWPTSVLFLSGDSSEVPKEDLPQMRWKDGYEEAHADGLMSPFRLNGTRVPSEYVRLGYVQTGSWACGYESYSRLFKHLLMQVLCFIQVFCHEYFLTLVEGCWRSCSMHETSNLVQSDVSQSEAHAQNRRNLPGDMRPEVFGPLSGLWAQCTAENWWVRKCEKLNHFK